MMKPRSVVVVLLAAACAETSMPPPVTPQAVAKGGTPWDETATQELNAYTRAEFGKWLTGDAEAVTAGVADDTALIYDVDATNTPVRIVGPEAVRKYAEGLGAFFKQAGLKGTVDAQVCRATATAGVCATEFHIDMPLPDGTSMSMKQRGTCVAAKGGRGWRWAHCHVSPAEWPEMPALKLESKNVNKDGLKWEKTPAGFEMAVVWQNPLSGAYAAYARFPIEWSDQTLHFHSATGLVAVLKGKMTHWAEGGTMVEVGPGGFAIIPGGREGAHTGAFDQDTLVFSVFDKPWDRMGVAETDAAASATPPAGAAPWDAAMAAEMESFARGQMANWETMNVDGIAATLAEAGLPSYDLDVAGKPMRMATRDDQIAYAKGMKEAGVQGAMKVKSTVCRGAQGFGWCAIDFDVTMRGPDGKAMDLSFRGTGVAARLDGAWKTIHWHGSMAKIPGPPPARLAGTNAQDLKWQELPGTGGVKLAVVFEDPATKGIAGFVQMPKRWKGFPNHFHTANMHYVVLGGVHAHVEPDGERRETKVGGWGFEVGKNVHRSEGKEGQLMFIVTDGPFDAVPVDDKGNPLPPPPAPGTAPKKK